MHNWHHKTFRFTFWFVIFFYVHVMLTLIMRGILVSLSLGPIKTDITSCGVCEENMNCGTFVFLCECWISTYGTLLEIVWNMSVFRRSQSSSVNQLWTALVIKLECAFHAEHTCEPLASSGACIALMWLVWKQQCVGFFSTYVCYNCVPMLSEILFLLISGISRCLCVMYVCNSNPWFPKTAQLQNYCHFNDSENHTQFWIVLIEYRTKSKRLIEFIISGQFYLVLCQAQTHDNKKNWK